MASCSFFTRIVVETLSWLLRSILLIELPNGLCLYMIVSVCFAGVFFFDLFSVNRDGMENSHVTSVTHVHHVGFEVQIQIYGLGEVVEKKPLVGASIRRLSLWNIQARTKQATGIALRGTLLRPGNALMDDNNVIFTIQVDAGNRA